MHKKLQEPFLIIKTSLGGQSLNFDFRPPSAGQWTPPEGHPDLIKKADEPAPAKIALPEKLDLPDDWTPEKPYALRRRHLGLDGFKGAEIGKLNGMSPSTCCMAPKERSKATPSCRAT
jgi:hypothetical protein